jgi:hypothetical protein
MHMCCVQVPVTLFLCVRVSTCSFVLLERYFWAKVRDDSCETESAQVLDTSEPQFPHLSPV